MKLAIFDICNTLYRSNTTYDFLLFYFKRNNRKKYTKFKRNFSIPAKVLWKALGVFGRNKTVRSYLINFIKDEPVEQVAREADCFVSEVLEHRKIKYTHDALKKLKKTDCTIFLMSASIEPVVQAIAENLEIKTFMASTLVKSNGTYLGKLRNDLEGKKDKVLTSLIDLKRFEKIEVFSDNIEDLQLLQLADNAHVMTTENNYTFWLNADLNPEHTKFIKSK